MTVLRLYVALCTGTFIIEGVCGQVLLQPSNSVVITTARNLEFRRFRSCRLNNSRTDASIDCNKRPFRTSHDCYVTCSSRIMELYTNNILGREIFDMWNLVGTTGDKTVLQTGFEIAHWSNGCSVSRNKIIRRIEYIPGKLKNVNFYKSCLLRNQAGITIYCGSHNRTLHDGVDCNDACAYFVYSVIDIEKIKGNWTLTCETRGGNVYQTGFNIILDNYSKTLETDHTDTTSEEPIEISTSVTTDAEYTETTTAIGEGTTILSDDGWHVIVPDSSFVISIPHRLVDIHGSCQLNNSVTGEIITCKSYWYDCNDICSHYALNLAKRNKLDTGIWNLIGTSYNSGAVFHTAFEIASVDTVYKRRSVKYNPEKLMSEHFICKLQNQAGTTIYCRTVCQDYECDKVDCNDVCTTFVDRVRDVEKIKGNWTLIGETHDTSSQTGFEIVVEEATDDSRTTTTDYTDTTTEEADEVSSSVTAGIEYTDIKPALVGATVSTGPISRSSDIQADRVVVEMPESLAVDQDLHFALSLVPMMRRRTLQDKLDVEIDILSYFKSKLANRTP